MIRQGILIFENSARGARAPSTRVAGLSLLNRGIRTLARVGVEQVLVLAPAGARLELDRLTRRLSTRLEFITWGTAPSLPFAPGPAVLLLAGEYVHHHSSLRRLREEGLGQADLVVHADTAPPQGAPLRAASPEGGAVDFAETAAPEGLVSTGAFLCRAELCPPAELAAAADLWSFLRLRAQGRSVARRQAGGLWRRVVDRRSARAAKVMLFSQVTKPTSGFVSRHLNARLSIPTSKLLVETGISPHLVTVALVLTTGLAAAYLITRPDSYLRVALTGILWQLSAVFDRCDGEVARVKLCESKFGAWFDTVTDNVAYLCAYTGMLVGMHRLHPDTPLYLYLGSSAIVAMLVTLTVMYRYAMKTGSGSLQNYLVGFRRHVPDDQKGLVYKLLEHYAFIAKRDFFSFVFFLACLANQFTFVYWFPVIGLHVVAAGVLLSQRKMLKAYHTMQAPNQPTTGLLPGSSPASAFGERR